MDKRTFRAGDEVRTSGIYRDSRHRLALAVGEIFPASQPKDGGWKLVERMAVQRVADLVDEAARNPRPLAPLAAPIIIDPVAMEYAIEQSYRGGWNGSLLTLEARILANGKGSKDHVLALIAELRIRRTIAGTKEGDPSDG